MKLPRKLAPAGLSGRLILLMLGALALSQALSMLVSRFERNQAVRGILRDECLGRMASALRLMEATPASQRSEQLEAVATPLARYWLSDEPPADVGSWTQIARSHLLKPVPAAGREGRAQESLFVGDALLNREVSETWTLLPADATLLRRTAHLLAVPEWNGFGVVTPLHDGKWLNMIYSKPTILSAASPSLGYYITLALLVALLAFATWLIARHITEPLRRLTDAAERLGRGEDVPLLPRDGPTDIEHTITTFNRMQVRLRRFIEDRTRMLAAIGHDLRTPITTMRLRAEFVKDQETREKLLATLSEMQAMTEATLAFARSEATAEPVRNVDLPSLLDSLCDDLSELGWEVSFENLVGDRVACPCRPDSLRRAVRNVIENAVRYGTRARVFLDKTPCAYAILVDDEGPGIAPEDRERVFQPFVRLEHSRNSETGGVGLGLSIARSVLRGHGGDIVLEDGPDNKGLRVRLLLPMPSSDRASA